MCKSVVPASQEVVITKVVRVLDFGARMYDPAVGIWHGVDAMSHKHPDLSPFVYCANNPILLVDPDGNDWIISRFVKDGITNYNITFTGAIMNSSGQNLDMNKLKSNISSSLMKVFSSVKGGDDVKVNFNVDLRVVNKQSDIKSTDHLISVYSDKEYSEIDGGGGTRGVADIGGKKIGLPFTTAQNIIDGKNDRTVAHEAGHTLGMRHPDDDDGIFHFGLVNQYDKSDNDNLMYGQSKYSTQERGYSLKKNQFEYMYNQYSKGKLNRNTVFTSKFNWSKFIFENLISKSYD